MKSFDYRKASNLEEACRTLNQFGTKARVLAGGTDILTVLYGDILPEYPEILVDIKGIPELYEIKETEDEIHIGSCVTLDTISSDPLLSEYFPALTAAADAVGSPQIRNIGTIGGNLCQDTRCWYYRYNSRLGGGPFFCPRKGGKGACPAVSGDNRYHCIMGGKRCFASCPSDTAVALTALCAKLVIAGTEGEREIEVSDLYEPLGNTLDSDEILKEIVLKKPAAGSKQIFLKHAFRKSIDFAVANVAGYAETEDGVVKKIRLVMGAVAPGPVPMPAVDEYLTGKQITGEIAEKAAEMALGAAKPLSRNAYKVDLEKALIRKALCALTGGRLTAGSDVHASV